MLAPNEFRFLPKYRIYVNKGSSGNVPELSCLEVRFEGPEGTRTIVRELAMILAPGSSSKEFPRPRGWAGRHSQVTNSGARPSIRKQKREGVAGATALSSLRALHRLQNENLALS